MFHFEVMCGPDQIKPSDKIYTTDPEEPVKLHIPASGKAIETLTPISIPSVFKRVVKDFGDHPALCYKVKNSWQTLTFRYEM